jgi:imidazolonepropionase-like amidohydrolase
VPIGFGTDAAVFLMVIMPRVYLYEKAGMPIMKAIQAATIVNAKILEMDQKNRQLRTGLFSRYCCNE